MLVFIDRPDDPRLRPYVAIRDPQLAVRDRVFVAEGREVVRRVLEATSTFRVRSVAVSAAARAPLQDALEALAPDVPVYEIAPGIIESVTGFNIHRGCLALVERPTPADWVAVARDAGDGPLVVLEDVGNPDNVGGVFRNARAFGARGVLMSPGCSDPLYRKAIRTSMGATVEVPFARLEPWTDGLLALRSAGWHLLGLTPAGNVTLAECHRNMACPSRVAVLAGHEGQGLSAAALAACDQRVSIPMAPGADSLNVSVAVAIALYEFGRNRHQLTPA